LKIKKSGWIDDNRKLGIAVSAAGAAYAVFETVRTGNYFDGGWPHPSLIAGLLSGVFCVGLVLRQAWSRWVGFLLLGGLETLILWHVYLHGISFARFIAIAAAPALAWYLWRLPITRVQELLSDPDFLIQARRRAAERRRNREPRNQWKIGVLFRDAVQLDAERLSRIAERAFGKPFAVMNRAIEPMDAVFLPSERSDPVVGGIAPTLLCYNPPQLLGVYVVSDPPAKTPGPAASSDSISAYVEVVVLPHVDSEDHVENGHAWTGKLAAELIDEGCISVSLPEAKRVFPVSAKLREALRSPDPAAALGL
jgi:hypothetical protein